MCGATHLESGKVNNAVDLGVLGEHVVEAGLVCDVDLVEGRALAADKLNAVYSGLGRVEETIDNDDIVVVLEEGEGSEGPDVTSTTVKSKAQLISRFGTEIMRAPLHGRSLGDDDDDDNDDERRKMEGGLRGTIARAHRGVHVVSQGDPHSCCPCGAIGVRCVIIKDDWRSILAGLGVRRSVFGSCRRPGVGSGKKGLGGLKGWLVSYPVTRTVPTAILDVLAKTISSFLFLDAEVMLLLLL